MSELVRDVDEEPAGSWADQVASDAAALDRLAPAQTVEVYGRLHATLQSALAATADTGSAAPRPGN